MSWRGRIPKQERIALVGKHPATAMLAPFADASWQIWTLNNGPRGLGLPRWDVLFELHDYHFGERGCPDYRRFLADSARDKLVFTARPHAVCPEALVFPREEIEAAYAKKLFSSTFAWMLAMAIEIDPEEIGLYGIELLEGSEYARQRPGMHYLIGYAEGRGIRVTIPPVSKLLPDCPPYQYAEAL